MKTRGTTFKLDLSSVERVGRKLSNKTVQYDKLMERRMKAAVDMVWRIAHQKRPMISTAQAKAQGRTRRISDPGAEVGVPVRTGALQASIQREVKRTKAISFIGKVWTKGIKYAEFIEYGTSKMAARPFMRPAINLTKDAIRRMFKLKVDSNL